jgi:hypothetical protein
MSEYDVNVWINVLETLRYKIGDEMSKSGSDINHITCSKQTSPTFKTIIEIYFNYKTSEISKIFIREHSAFPNHDDKMVTTSDFVNNHLQYFRDSKINSILNK